MLFCILAFDTFRHKHLNVITRLSDMINTFSVAVPQGYLYTFFKRGRFVCCRHATYRLAVAVISPTHKKARAAVVVTQPKANDIIIRLAGALVCLAVHDDIVDGSFGGIFFVLLSCPLPIIAGRNKPLPITGPRGLIEPKGAIFIASVGIFVLRLHGLYLAVEFAAIAPHFARFSVVFAYYKRNGRGLR